MYYTTHGKYIVILHFSHFSQKVSLAEMGQFFLYTVGSTLFQPFAAQKVIEFTCGCNVLCSLGVCGNTNMTQNQPKTFLII